MSGQYPVSGDQCRVATNEDWRQRSDKTKKQENAEVFWITMLCKNRSKVCALSDMLAKLIIQGTQCLP